MNKITCPFCDQAQEYRYILELKKVRVIYPKNPACQYHALIVPKRHTSHIDDLSAEEWQEVSDAIKKIVTAGKDHITDFEGYNLLSNNGSDFVRQRVPHAHMHIFLRRKSEPADPLSSEHSKKIRDFTNAEEANMLEFKSWLKSE